MVAFQHGERKPVSVGVKFALTSRGSNLQDTEEAGRGPFQFFPSLGDLPGAWSPLSCLGWGKGRPLVILEAPNRELHTPQAPCLPAPAATSCQPWFLGNQSPLFPE